MEDDTQFLKKNTDVYMSHFINDDQTFWCQSASSEEHDEILLGLSEVENSAGQNHIDPDALVPGSLCIARFLDDEFWYRAEVIDKNEGELSVFFLDYGNKTRVSITDVREMPPCLLKIPPQAFLCELEGFDVLSLKVGLCDMMKYIG
uniref:Tudor domain-containing protein n=1 Tax=Astatotilapia calliptera TaxID=8154 RepID=A0AAX7UWL9_ASTCA